MTLLKIYSLYKQASAGDVEGKRPGFTDMVGRAKFDAWAAPEGQDHGRGDAGIHRPHRRPEVAAAMRLLRRQALVWSAATAALGCARPLLAQPRSAIRIGSTFDHSSVEKANGNALHLGATAFFKAFNKLRPSLQVELVDRDDQFKPELAKSNAQALAADPAVLALLHPLAHARPRR